MVLADNGASQEGGPFGVMHEMKFFNGILETPDEAVARIDDIGGPHSHTNYPWGWAQCGNTPFKWYKQNTHEGGVHVPMIVHWPDGHPRRAAEAPRRDQFAFVSDVAPTIYELLGIAAPGVREGVEQLPVTGLVVRLRARRSRRARHQPLQYFEKWAAGPSSPAAWKAVCKHEQGADYDTEPWELYHLADDRSECNDLGAPEPERLAALIERWWEEAERHGVLPLDDRGRRAVRRPLP